MSRYKLFERHPWQFTAFLIMITMKGFPWSRSPFVLTLDYDSFYQSLYVIILKTFPTSTSGVQMLVYTVCDASYRYQLQQLHRQIVIAVVSFHQYGLGIAPGYLCAADNDKNLLWWSHSFTLRPSADFQFQSFFILNGVHHHSVEVASFYYSRSARSSTFDCFNVS